MALEFSKFYHKLAKESSYPFLIRAILLIMSSWLFQGLLYMDRTEKNFKIFLDIILFILLFPLIVPYLNNFLAFIVALIISHTINWIFNGQIFVVFKNLKILTTENKDFIKYLNQIRKRLNKENSIILAATFGSFSREELKKTSDLDIRIVRKNGFVNGLRSSYFVMVERSIALFNRFPLDIYLLDDINGLDNLGEDPKIFYQIDH